MAEEFLWWERDLGQEAEGWTGDPARPDEAWHTVDIGEGNCVRRALGSSVADSARRAESPAWAPRCSLFTGSARASGQGCARPMFCIRELWLRAKDTRGLGIDSRMSWAG